MSQVVIRASDLRKVYRLYSKPSYRFRDMFGLLGAKPGAYTEHAALDGINLEIRRGEKVAIIGRNGAGKSTFLKLVTNVVSPTSGRLEVSGQVQALLQIGTGFHPDFTGRENVYAYFAQLGIAGEEARRKCEETIEFAELEEYIDQPMKTYSTGMGVRLMFSASTAVTPDLLVLDEVLGVGDAYFTHKSYERIRGMCDQQGTTLLLVTHDIYSATQICGRVVWIDSGRVVMDDDGPTVIRAYEDSIRQQEERRIRLKKQQQLRAADSWPAGESHVIVEIQSRNNEAQSAPLHVSRLELFVEGTSVGSLPLGDSAFESPVRHLQREGSAWGSAGSVQGRNARPLLNYGTPFHKVAGVFETRLDTGAALVVELDYYTEREGFFVVRAFKGSTVYELGELNAIPGGWSTFRTAAAVKSSIGSETSLSGRQGTADIDVLDVRVVDEKGMPAHVIDHGCSCTFSIDYRINNPSFHEKAQVLLAFHRDGVHDVSRAMTRGLEFDVRHRSTGTIVLRLPKMLFGVGNYTISVLIGAEGYHDRQQTLFYSINPGVYAVVSRVLDIVVVGGGLVASGTGVVIEGEWTLADIGGRG